MTNETETFLILKYGSMDNALAVWLPDRLQGNGVFTDTENKILLAYSDRKFSNLQLENTQCKPQ